MMDNNNYVFTLIINAESLEVAQQVVSTGRFEAPEGVIIKTGYMGSDEQKVSVPSQLGAMDLLAQRMKAFPKNEHPPGFPHVPFPTAAVDELWDAYRNEWPGP